MCVGGGEGGGLHACVHTCCACVEVSVPHLYLSPPQVVDGGRHLYIVTEYAAGGEVFGEYPFMCVHTYVAEGSELQVLVQGSCVCGGS